MPNHHPVHLLARIKDTVHNNYRYEPHFSEAEIHALISHGQRLGLEPDLIHDLICCGHRRGKQISVKQLKKQMAWYQNTIRQRGFPFRFNTLSQYRAFSASVMKMLKGLRLPTQLVFVHGSALRDPGARDVDLILRLPDHTYDSFAKGEAVRDPRSLNKALDQIKNEFQLGGLDLLVVKDKTYFPNQPYLPLQA